MSERADGVRTHCPYCSLQCGTVLRPDPGGAAPLSVAGWPEFPVSQGALCGKGQSAVDLLDPAGRLGTPLVRDGRGTPLRPATWDEALGRVTSGIRSAQRAYGRDAVGVFGGGGLTNEKAYLLGKFARVALGTSAIDYNGRFCMSSAAAAANR
ncbi:molybdopterin oxidoreductase family protein, partial [Streptomyces caniscabiei]